MKNRSTSRTRRALLLAVLGLAAGAQATTEYGGPVKILVGYAPGGPADTVARIVAEKLAGQLGQTVIVDNRPGAGGQIAAQQLKNSSVDGSTLFLSNVHTVAMIPLINKAPGFSTRDFQPLGSVASFELALAAHPSTNARNLEQLGRWFAQHLSQTGIGVPAPGSAPELLAKVLAQTFKVDSVPIAYKGAAPMVQDLLGAQVAAGVSAVSDFLPYHHADRVRILAVTNATPLLPGVPTFKDAGLTGLDLTDLLGLYAPAAMPASLATRYNGALQRVMAMPDVLEKLRALAMTPAPGTAAEHAQQLARITGSLADAVRKVGYAPP